MAVERAVAIYEQLAQTNFTAYGPALAASLYNLLLGLTDNKSSSVEETKQLEGIKAQLHQIKRRVRDEGIQVPAYLAKPFDEED